MTLAHQPYPVLPCLKRATDPRWLDVVIPQTDRLLADHAHCEKKAAASAMALVAKYPDEAAMVRSMVHLAQEELGHFDRVHQLLVARGWKLGRIDKDPYVGQLLELKRRNDPDALVDHLLILSLVEARSCERFVLLAEHHPDPELAAMYREFCFAEAGHHHLFVNLAGHYAPKEAVAARLDELCSLEADILGGLALAPRMH